jgi:Mor family transcriptional regulator
MLEKSKIDILKDFTEDEVAALKPKELSPEEQVTKMYLAGVTVKAIASQFNLSIGKVYEVLSRKQVPLRNGRTSGSKSAQRLMTMTSMQKQNLINDYRDGMALADIYDKYKINKHGVYTILDGNNVPRRDNKTRNHNHNNSRKKEEEVEVGTPSEILTALDQRIAVHTGPVELRREGDTLHVTVFKKRISQVENIILNVSLAE